jgi:hypothetical protein
MSMLGRHYEGAAGNNPESYFFGLRPASFLIVAMTKYDSICVT